MQSQVQKWGNGLYVRIPRALAGQIGLGAGSEVSLSARDGELVVKPVRPTRLNLDDLLAGVTAENLHPSVDTGEAVGLEIFSCLLRHDQLKSLDWRASKARLIEQASSTL